MKIDIRRLLGPLDDWAYSLVEKAVAPDATLVDVGIAAAAVRTAIAGRRRLMAWSDGHAGVYSEYLVGLSLSQMSVDTGEDLELSQAVADAISRAREACGD